MKNWKTTLGGILTAIGLANQNKSWGNVVAAIGALLAGVSARDHDTTDPTPPNKFTLPIVLLCFSAALCFFLTGCARFHSEQTQVRADGTRTESHQDITTFLASKTAIAKLRVATSDKQQGLTVGAIDQESNASDLVAAAVKAAVEAAAPK